MTAGVILDLDDTLYPERSYFESGVAAVGEWVARRTGDPAAVDAIRLDVERLGRDGFISRVPAPDGVDPDAWRLSLLAVYRAHRPRLTLFEDAADFLSRVRSAGARIAVVTDGKSRVQWRKAEALDLPGRVDAIVCTDDIDRPKPAPDAFAVACELIGVPPEQCAYVADDPVKDFIGPRLLGMRTVHVHRGLPWPLARPAASPDHHAEHTVASLAEALAALGL